MPLETQTLEQTIIQTETKYNSLDYRITTITLKRQHHPHLPPKDYIEIQDTYPNNPEIQDEYLRINPLNNQTRHKYEQIIQGYKLTNTNKQ